MKERRLGKTKGERMTTKLKELNESCCPCPNCLTMLEEEELCPICEDENGK